MNIVDSSGWLEYFADGPNAKHFATPLKETEQLIVPTISLYEVFKVVLRERGEDAALQGIALMRQGQIVDLNAELALLAAKIGLEYRLPMADAIMLATAEQYKAEFWTQDDDFAEIKGVHYFPKKSG